MTKEISKNYARLAYFTYGYLPLLRVLQIYEQREQFEVCAQLKIVLNEYCAGYPHQFTTEAVEVVKKDLQERETTAEGIALYFENFGHYVVECRKYLDKHLKLNP